MGKRHIAISSAWSLVDQGGFAVANFLLNVYLARHLPVVEYGVFSGSYAVFLLFSSIYLAVFVEPMMVYGSQHFRGRTSLYLGRLFGWHLKLSAVLLAVAGVLAALAVLQSRAALGGVAALVAVAPAILWQWLVRQSCYIEERPKDAALGGLAYMVLLAGLLLLADATTGVTVVSAFVCVGLASAAAAALIGRSHRGANTSEEAGRLLDEAWGFHGNFSRSSVVTAACYWVPNGLPVLLLPLVSGAEAVAAQRVIMNLLLPVTQMLAAVSRLFVPWFSTAGHYMNLQRCSRLLLLVTGGFGLVVVLAGDLIVQLVYGKAYGCSLAGRLIVAVIAVSAGQVAVHIAQLQVQKRQAKVALSFGFGALAATLAAYPLIRGLVVDGALAVVAVGSLVTLAGLLYHSHAGKGTEAAR